MTTTEEWDQQRILDKNTAFHIKEAYKALRTNMMFSLAGKESKKIVITSSYPGEGKSTACINLAMTFAEMGKKVIIIDGDLRKPTMHQKLGITHDRGLAHVITGLATSEEVIIKDVRENLDSIPAGYTPPNPAELLASQEMDELLKSLEAHYEYIFIDTPPLNVVTDATLLSSKASGTILIVRQDITHYRDIAQAIEKLEFAHAKILGFILQGAKEKSRKYKKYGKYAHYGRYGSYEAISD